MRHARPQIVALAAAVLLVAAVPARASSAATDTAVAAAAPGRGRHEPTGRVVVRFEPGASADQRRAALVAAGLDPARAEDRGHGIVAVAPPEGDDAVDVTARLAVQGVVRTAASEGRVRALAVQVPPDDPDYAGAGGQESYLGPRSANPWSVNLEPAWDRAFNAAEHTLVDGRAGVRIAVIDTGVSMPYPESTGEITPVWDYIGNDADPADGNGHGTRVTSILRAKTANTKTIAGALHSSANQVMVYRVLDASGLGETADFLAAIYDAVDDGARIINCSLGESLYEADGTEVEGLRDSYADAVEYAWAHDCIIVAAAGNHDGASLPSDWFTYAPACIDQAVAVGAVDPDTGVLAGFSNYGPENEVDVVAPGVGIWGLSRAGTASTGQGTSYATPIVTGALALLLSCAPSADPTTAVAALMRSGSSWPVKAIDAGYGIPDVDTAYSLMTTWLPEQSAVTLTPGSPDGRTVTLSWSAADGAGVTYTYGEAGGPTYATTARSAQLVLSAEGDRTAWVRSWATDRWSHQATVTAEVAVAADGLGPLPAERHAGATRYETAVAASRRSHPATAAAVVVASGKNWPDALSAAPLAAAAGGPLLLTDPSSLTIATRDEIARLAPDRIYVVGGTAAVSTAVRNQLDALRYGDTVARLAGDDRYATAAAVADELAAELGGVPGSRAFVCSGAGYADALSAAAAAAAAGQPVLLTAPNALSAPTAAAITDLGITSSVVVGGIGAVSDTALAALPGPERVGGADRYATSRAVADWATGGGVLAFDAIGCARGDSFPDALAAGPFMGTAGGPIVLLPSASDAPLTGWLATHGPEAGTVTFFGGPSAVTYGLENDVRLALRGQ